MSAIGEWASQRKRVFVAMLLGAAIGTILWFALSPSLNRQQENMVSWLLMGSYLLVAAVTLLRVRRKAHHDRP
jgi:uncharacterized membrane protein